jgi:hypothetical protein
MDGVDSIRYLERRLPIFCLSPFPLFYTLAVKYTKLIEPFSTVSNYQAVDDVLRRILRGLRGQARSPRYNDNIVYYLEPDERLVQSVRGFKPKVRNQGCKWARSFVG